MGRREGFGGREGGRGEGRWKGAPLDGAAAVERRRCCEESAT